MVQEPQEAGQAPLGGDRHLGGVQGEEGLDLSEVDLRLDLREHPVRSGFSGAPGEKDAKEFTVIFFVAADHNRHSEVSSRRV